jgi:mannose-6-phosphate isomerase-like protein (cupin superfamily)
VKAGRGTNLWRNGDEMQKLTISPTPDEKKCEYENIMVIVDTWLGPAPKNGLETPRGITVHIMPNAPYMVMNNSSSDIIISFTVNPAEHQIIYNPYEFEYEDHSDYDPDLFKLKHPVPDGYVDTLPKWYSVKFTYPKFNYIFVRPGLGISLQTHKMREEMWEILEGNPIIISGSKVYYDVSPGQKYTLPLGALHAVINPSQEKWVLLKEEYLGQFDEKDIVRVFNPNHYY